MSTESATPPAASASPGAAPVAPAAAPAKPTAAPAVKPPAPPPPPPDPAILALRDEVQKALGAAAVWEWSGKLPAFRVAPAELHAAARKLKEMGFDYCLFVTAVDYPAQERFEVLYALTNYRDGREVALLTDLRRADPAVDTVSDLWPTAEWHEREVYDLFGIKFHNHGDLRRILLDESWEGHPLRKDYTDTLHGMVKRPY
jgi:NADH/F420H2 dehydrogenase subunit C